MNTRSRLAMALRIAAAPAPRRPPSAASRQTAPFPMVQYLPTGDHKGRPFNHKAVAPPTLFLVSTPIGNLEDITLRALRVLREVSLIAAEDTRHTAKLLSHFDIRTPTTSFYEQVEREKTPRLLARLAAGESIALVSDAGTPGVSDPGYRLVKAAVAGGRARRGRPGRQLDAGRAGSVRPADERVLVPGVPAGQGAGARPVAVWLRRPDRDAGALRSAPPRSRDARGDSARFGQSTDCRGPGVDQGPRGVRPGHGVGSPRTRSRRPAGSSHSSSPAQTLPAPLRNLCQTVGHCLPSLVK